nr:hypothetical protein [Tanacetum cinerariifolium]
MPHECLAIIQSKSKVRYSRNKPVVAKVSMNASTSGVSPDVAKLKDMVKALLLDKKSQNQSPAPVKAAPTKGYEDAIVVPAITADNFELKHGLLTLVQNKQFFGHDKEDPLAHVCYFNKITSTLKFPNVSNTLIKLMLFPFSLEGAARIWLKKEPPRSIFTWDDLFSKFINQFFPPSKTTNLRNKITNFEQRLEEYFSEEWDRFKDLLRACPHHDMVKALLIDEKSQNQSPAPVKAVEECCVTCGELHQLDMFYNALNSKDQDSLNSAAGGNFLDKMPSECLAIIGSKSKVCYSHNKPIVSKVSTNASTPGVSPDVAELKDMVKALLLDKKSQNQSPALVKAVEESCVTCDGAHSYRNCPATDGHVYQPLVFQPPTYQAPAYQAPAPQTQGVSKEDFSSYVKANDAVMRNMRTQGQNMQNQLTNLTYLITNGMSYDGPRIPPPPSSLPKVVENKPEVTKDTVNPTNNGNTEDVQPQAVQSESPVLISKPVISPISEPAIALVSASKPNPKASIPYPLRRNDEMNHEKANNKIKKFCQIFKDMSFKISFADALILMPKFASTLKALIENKEKLSEMSRTSLNEYCSTVLLKKLPEKLGDPGKFLIPCDFLELADRWISHPVGVAEDVYVK